MARQFLYEQLDSVSKLGFLKKEMPDFVVENLNPSFELREYQKEAFARFFHCFNEMYEDKEHPLHLLFNMATGSGKTLIMAGLILYLYEQGYRNFLFFVNSTNIIEKTKDNFLNNLSGKYLFNKKISFKNKPTAIKQVDNFDGVSADDINICFTTIQKLHSDLHNEKENGLTFEDFAKKKIVLISDEAHHGQVQTRQRVLGEKLEKPNWENTVEKIFKPAFAQAAAGKQNSANLLLEFTATIDYSDNEIAAKYLNKIIYRYDLKEFRNDGFSKEVELLSSDTGKKDRIIQAIILSQYRQEAACKHNINLKPVVLFKAQKTIDQSKENKALFHKIIDGLKPDDIAKIREKTNVSVLKQAFAFFKDNKISDSILIKKLKDGFAENKTLSVNEEKEKEEYQLLLNSLEDKNNQIRAIFAVQKLNEGWDVLNLFDIVRLYEERDSHAGNRIGKTTISEAQLIGRGARYFPFAGEGIEADGKFKRKYDKNLDHELRILEELHYHSHDESRYISELKTALINEGLIDENEIEVELNLKEEFKQKKFYKSGVVWANKKIKTDFSKVKSIGDLGVSQSSIDFSVRSGAGRESKVFTDEGEDKSSLIAENSKEIGLKDIPVHIIKNALARNDFYEFSNLKIYFPKLKSLSDFIGKKEYLAGLKIIFRGQSQDLNKIGNRIKLLALLKLLNAVEAQIKGNLTEYQGSEKFDAKNIYKIFTDKKIKIKKESGKLDGQIALLRDKEWYVFNANYGTSEEKDFVEFIAREAEEFKKKYDEFYLIRNERHLKIYNFKDGQAFEPDYLLFLIGKQGKNLTYQLFLEPKGKYLQPVDKWKEEFLKEIKERFKEKIFKFGESKKYKVIGVPFYQNEMENEFKEKLFDALE